MTLDNLCKIIVIRKNVLPNDSYIAALFRGRKDRIIQKIGEEATEVVIAAKNTNKRRQIEEITDLIFHILLLMVKFNISLIDIYTELDKRHMKRS